MTGAEFGFIAIRNGSLKHLKIKAVHSLDSTAAQYWQERYDPITIEPDNIVGRTYLERRRQIANASTEPGDLFLLDLHFLFDYVHEVFPGLGLDKTTFFVFK